MSCLTLVFRRPHAALFGAVVAMSALLALAAARDARADDAPELRTWRSRRGQEVSASLAGVGSGFVTLNLADGGQVTIRLADLSAEDQAFVRKAGAGAADGAAPRSGASWASWRGPDGDGISPETDWDPRALEGGAKFVWEKDVGRGWSTVSIAGGRLYTMGNRDNHDIVHCLNPATGEELWTHRYPCGAGSYPGPRATPVVDEDRVYTVSREGLVLCLGAEDGGVRWQRNVASEDGAAPPRWGHSASPVIDGELLMLNAGRNGMALNKRTGEPVWTSRGVCGYAAPVPYRYDGKNCYAIFGAKALYGVTRDRGDVLWSHDWVTEYDVNAADPIVVGDDAIFISSGYGKGCALLRLAPRGVTAAWQSTVMRNHFSTCVLLDGYLYGIDGNAGRGTLRCVKADSGNEEWSAPVGFGSLIAAGDKLIVLNERGVLFIAEAKPSAYRELSSAPVLKRPKCWTSPVLCGGLLYCRNSEGDMVCVDLR